MLMIVLQIAERVSSLISGICGLMRLKIQLIMVMPKQTDYNGLWMQEIRKASLKSFFAVFQDQIGVPITSITILLIYFADTEILPHKNFLLVMAGDLHLLIQTFIIHGLQET